MDNSAADSVGARAKATKFSAAFEDDDSLDSTTMMDEDDRRNGKTTKPPPPVFEAAGFTFQVVADVSLMTIEPYVSSTATVDAQTSIQHDHSRRKNRQFCHCHSPSAS